MLQEMNAVTQKQSLVKTLQRISSNLISLEPILLAVCFNNKLELLEGVLIL